MLEVFFENVGVFREIVDQIQLAVEHEQRCFILISAQHRIEHRGQTGDPAEFPLSPPPRLDRNHQRYGLTFRSLIQMNRLLDAVVLDNEVLCSP
jgi:hypothetical protein